MVSLLNQHNKLIACTSTGRLKLVGSKKINFTGIAELLRPIIRKVELDGCNLKQFTIRGYVYYLKKIVTLIRKKKLELTKLLLIISYHIMAAGYPEKEIKTNDELLYTIT